MLDSKKIYTDEPLIRDIRTATSNIEFALMPPSRNLAWEPDALEVARNCHAIIARCNTIIDRVEGTG